jgi:hypothetical protein
MDVLFFVLIVSCLFFSGCILGIRCLLLLALQIFACFLDLLLFLLRSLAELLRPIFCHVLPFDETKPTVYVIESHSTTEGYCG